MTLQMEANLPFHSGGSSRRLLPMDLKEALEIKYNFF